MSALGTRIDARANRIRLLAAATAVFAEHGIDVDIKDVADRARLAVGTIYRHFPGKDELIVAVLEEAVREYAAAVEEGLADPEPVEGIGRYIRGGLAVMDRYGELMAALLEGRAPGARSAARRAYRRAGTAARIRALVQRGVDAGLLRPGIDVDVAAAMLKAVFAPWALGELRGTRTPEQISSAVLDIFLGGAAGTMAADRQPEITHRTY